MPASNSRSKKPGIFGVQEWAVRGYSIFTGCAHDCLYCYAKSQAVRFKGVQPDCWKQEKLDREAFYRPAKIHDGQVMFPHLHDITGENVDTCLAWLVAMLKLGNKMLVVMKPAPDVVAWLCREMAKWKAQVLYRFTIGSADDTELAFWEPNAPKLADRVTSLAKALEAGYQTSVSMEPMLDAEPWKLIEVIRPLVSHSIWLGLPNFMAKRLTTNMAKGPDYEHAMTRALRLHSLQNEKWVHALYQKYREDKLVRWKDSIKKLVGLPPPARAGLDI